MSMANSLTKVSDTVAVAPNIKSRNYTILKFYRIVLALYDKQYSLQFLSNSLTIPQMRTRTSHSIFRCLSFVSKLGIFCKRTFSDSHFNLNFRVNIEVYYIIICFDNSFP
jgi:hypothetical protein